tara:strand:+ start:6527 stop:8242 length:1716 start_codon:yes stop_codon:yes gene_type:complete
MAVEKTIKINVETKRAVSDIKKLRSEADAAQADLRRTIPVDIDATQAKTTLKDVDNEAKKTASGVKGVGKGAEESKKGFKTMKIGIQSVNTALKAMGIGLVIAAFVQLQKALGKNQVVIDKLSIASEAIGLVFKKLTNIIIDTFSSPKKFIEGFWEALKQNVVNRVTAIIDLFGALGKVIKGVFTRDLELMKEGAQDAGGALRQMSTGITPEQFEELSVALKKTKDEIKKSTKEAIAYGKAMTALRNEVKLAEANQRQLQLTYQKDAELQRQIRDDISLTFEERIAANEEIGRILDKQFADEEALAQKKVALAQLELSQNKDNVDLQVALINAKTELADLDERITGQRSEQLVNLKALEAEQAVALQEQLDAEKARRLLEQEAAELGLEFDKNISDARLKILVDEGKKELAITKAKIAADKALRVGAAKDILGSIAQLAGEGTAAAKAAALAGILIDTAKGVSGAIAAGAGLPFPLNLGAIATGVASVLAGIVNAKAVLKKVPGGGDGPDPQIDVPTDSGGPEGLNLGAPNIESIEQPELGQMAPTQAYVVESDISNAQALQQELDLQATL